jgi:hypothetical protein
MIDVSVAQFLAPTFGAERVGILPDRIARKRLLLQEVTKIDEYIQQCNQDSVTLKTSGEHRKSDWELGWSGHGIYSGGGDYDNLPFYFKNNTHIRANGSAYKDLSGFAELDILRALQAVVFHEALAVFRVRAIFEYGCGTGSNIQFLRDLYPAFDFYASDWVVSARENLLRRGLVIPEQVFILDYFDSTTFVGANQPYVAFTNASLEQTGDRFEPFIDYLIGHTNCVGGIHIEPIREILDLSNPLNRQSYDYAQRRNYLKDFSVVMSKKSSIKIIDLTDFGLGSRLISGYQVLVWEKS